MSVRFSRIFRYLFFPSSSLIAAYTVSSTSLVNVEDEEECETPICHDAHEAIKEYSSPYFNIGNNNNSNNNNNNRWRWIAPDRQQLGRHSWTLLHTIAAYWPQNPTKEQKEDIINFLNLLSKVYPCHICASDLEYQLENYPPNVENRDEFIKWICNLHNRINKRLRKPTFDCNNHQKRWKRQHEYNWRDIEEREELDQDEE